MIRLVSAPELDIVEIPLLDVVDERIAGLCIVWTRRRSVLRLLLAWGVVWYSSASSIWQHYALDTIPCIPCTIIPCATWVRIED